MRKIFLFISILVSVVGYGQATYNPSFGTVSNKPYSPGSNTPTDGRTWFYDSTFFKWRPYVNTAEVLSYLNLAKYRSGQFDIIINTGGSLSSGVITGGTNAVWYFKNGTANSDLVLKSPIQSVNGQTGIIVVKNADSLKGSPIDTTGGIKNNYYLSYDSIARKWVLSQPSAGYVAGTGINISGTTISALNTSALWNSNQIRGRAITTAAPTTGDGLVWNGTQFVYSASGGGGSGVDSGYISGDTLYLISSTDTVAIPGISGNGGVWSLTGNNVTNSNWFLGSTNNIGIPFRTNNVERMRIDSVGKIGIGISAMAGQLEIYNTNTSGGLSGLYITHTSTSTDPTTDYGSIQINNIDNTPNNYSSIVFGGTDQHTSGVFNINTNPASNYANLGFYTNGAGGFTEKLHIYDDARVRVKGSLIAESPSGYSSNLSLASVNDSSFITKSMLNNFAVPPTDLDIPVLASGGILNNGNTNLTVVQHVGWRVRVYRNYGKQSVNTALPTYYSFNPATGVYTFTPAVTTGESIQLEAY